MWTNFVLGKTGSTMTWSGLPSNTVSFPPRSPTTLPTMSPTGLPTQPCLTDCLNCRWPLVHLACMETRFCTRISMIVIILVLCGLFVIWTFHDQIRDLLPWLIGTDPYLGIAIFFLLFAVVALPSSIPGYLLLNIAAGYRFGLVFGTLVVVTCALGGAYLAFVFCRLSCTAFLLSKLQNDYLQAIVNLVEGEHSFKVIALTRLTPIPFGLQNGIFAMANVSVSTFVSATAVGLFPNQLLSSYLGSTLRSVQDITDSQWNGSPVVIVQVCISISLSCYVIIKAQQHFHRVIHDHRINKIERNHVISASPERHPDHRHTTFVHVPEDKGHDLRVQIISVLENEIPKSEVMVRKSDQNLNEVWT